ncbi:hypothetical protein GLOTRDRAFT_138451 [Gloeophyllum trabeum ATCC 11539]|uniref:F-box domain-containing protein n=1 Tax=Gloeophyllum trabeum (strain ATCC 11539 / FP-39264 / Madison 617) TaxID=670483 RepID=S7Q668_GLOTA|nr:uncharacterized protein GLOTRDRAFT_138451 [Gloeophyllum trabeum ATCC 11539]EPQ55556.1 hypothetical protein GLOTRDRAFT_138451 [Gloeophyllum trabeum ATCC 11539]
MTLAARRDIEEQIAQRHGEIIDLKRRLNTLVLVARLPPELLAEVFIAYAELSTSQHVDQYHGYTVHQYRSRFRIAQVCHHWREVALQNPRLWADISLVRLPCVKEMLARSKEAPLTIRGSMDDSLEGRDLFRCFIGELHRVRHLNLTVQTHILRQFHRSELTHMPLLRSLKLSASYGESPRSAEPLPFISTLAPTQLRELDVTGYPLDSFRMFILPSLTSLSWSGHSIKSTVSTVLALLRDTPLLCSLALSNSPSISGEDLLLHISERHVDLPHLQRLYIDCDVVPCAEFVAHTSFPVEAAIHLKVDGLLNETQPQAVEAIASVIDRMTDAQPLRTLLIKRVHTYGRALEFKGWTHVLPHESDSHQPSPKVQLTALDGGIVAQSIMAKLGRRLPLSDVEYLQLEDIPGFEAWKTSFGHMSKVTKLRVNGLAADFLSTALHFRKSKKKNPGSQNRDLRDVKDNDPDVRLFPRLQCLQLEEVRFYEIYEEPTDEDVIDNIEAALASRKVRRRKFQHLDIRRAINFGKDELARLQRVVKTLTWDGEVSIEDVDEDEDEEYYGEENDYYSIGMGGFWSDDFDEDPYYFD